MKRRKLRNENYDDTSDRSSQEEKKELEKQPVRFCTIEGLIRLEGSWITYSIMMYLRGAHEDRVDDHAPQRDS